MQALAQVALYAEDWFAHSSVLNPRWEDIAESLSIPQGEPHKVDNSIVANLESRVILVEDWRVSAAFSNSSAGHDSPVDSNFSGGVYTYN